MALSISSFELDFYQKSLNQVEKNKNHLEVVFIGSLAAAVFALVAGCFYSSFYHHLSFQNFYTNPEIMTAASVFIGGMLVSALSHYHQMKLTAKSQASKDIASEQCMKFILSQTEEFSASLRKIASFAPAIKAGFAKDFFVYLTQKLREKKNPKEWDEKDQKLLKDVLKEVVEGEGDLFCNYFFLIPTELAYVMIEQLEESQKNEFKEKIEKKIFSLFKNSMDHPYFKKDKCKNSFFLGFYNRLALVLEGKEIKLQEQDSETRAIAISNLDKKIGGLFNLLENMQSMVFPKTDWKMLEDFKIFYQKVQKMYKP